MVAIFRSKEYEHLCIWLKCPLRNLVRLTRWLIHSVRITVYILIPMTSIFLPEDVLILDPNIHIPIYGLKDMSSQSSSHFHICICRFDWMSFFTFKTHYRNFVTIQILCHFHKNRKCYNIITQTFQQTKQTQIFQFDWGLQCLSRLLSISHFI